MSEFSNDNAKTFKRTTRAALLLAAFAAGFCALLPFRAAAADELDKLKREVREFHEHAEDVIRLDKEDMEEMWNTYCGEFDPMVEGEKDVAAALGRRLQEKEVGLRQQLIVSEYPKLEKLAATVQVTSSSDKEELEKLKEAASKDLKKLEALENGLVLKGGGHPFVQFASDYGIRMHESMCGNFGDSDTRVCNKRFDGINRKGRPDLVVIEGGYLKVYEFKPDNSKAKSQGEEQLKDYVPAVAKYYEQFFPNGRTGGIDKSKSQDSDRKVKEITKALENSPNAWDGNKLRVQKEVKTYKMCDRQF